LEENSLKVLVQKGCFAVAVAEPSVIRICMEYALEKEIHLLLEATVNQVNQHGGYTGMKPADYVHLVQGIAAEVGLPPEKLILCGDHLGPFAWRHLPASEAMANSIELVRQYVAAGFRKIHLDPTMALGDDVPGRPLSNKVIAERATILAEVSESEYASTRDNTPWHYRPAYIIGSEVPAPGGTTEDEEAQVTSPAALIETLQAFRQAFMSHSLPQVWENTVGVVAQIGVEFSDDGVHEYKPGTVNVLSSALSAYPGVTIESHSTDYQPFHCLRQMVQDGAGILKVGPEMTFALREGLFALAMIEQELRDKVAGPLSNFVDVLDCAMVTGEPDHWTSYYHGTEDELKRKRKYSLSDRSRYYLALPEVRESRARLLYNLAQMEIPLSLLSQYLPIQYQRVRDGRLARSPNQLLVDKVRDVLDRYHGSIAAARTQH